MPQTSDASYVELQPAKEQVEPEADLKTVVLLSAVALTSGMANGYNGTVLEGLIPRLQHFGYFEDALEMGLLEGSLSLGGLIGSVACAPLSLALSRRSLVIVGEATISGGVLCLAAMGPVNTLSQGLVGRIATGLGVGVCGFAKPLIVSELAPPRRRGLLVAFFAVGQSIGMNLFYLADWALPGAASSWAWRLLVALGAMPAFLVMCLALMFRDRRDYWDVPPTQQSARGQSSVGMLVRMLTVEPPRVRRNFGLIIALMIGYNLSGTLIISNYASDILHDTTRKLPIVIGLVQLCGLLSAASLADRVGRRPLLLGSCILTVLGLLSIALLLGSTASLPPSSGGGGGAEQDGLQLWAVLLLMMIIEYAVGAGLNPIRIILSAELMPNAYRSLGMSLGNASGWLLALASLFLYPVISANVGGPAPQFAFFGCVVTALTVLLAFQLPETNGIDFEADGSSHAQP